MKFENAVKYKTAKGGSPPGFSFAEIRDVLPQIDSAQQILTDISRRTGINLKLTISFSKGENEIYSGITSVKY